MHVEWAGIGSLVAGVALAFVIAPVQAGKPFKPGKLSKEEQAALKPGLSLRFLDKENKSLDARRTRLAAFHLSESMSASPFVDAPWHTAKLTGYIKIALKSEFTFRITTIGSARLSINGKEVLKVISHTASTAEPIPLAKGFNRIEVDYVRPPRGASLRVYWTGEGFVTEPLPPDLLFTKGDEPDLVRGEELREGRFLYATLGCARCHELPAGVKESELGMPELRFQRPPSLENVGRRLTSSWMKAWIADPRHMNPQATMPQIIAARENAGAIAAYLAGLQSGPALHPTASTEELIGQGEKHFANLGCVACHTFEERDEERNRRSLMHVKAKFQRGALEAFLREPHKYYPWIRMPDFRMNADEAASVAAFVNSRAKGVVEPDNSDAMGGEKLFREGECASCHTTKVGESLVAKRRPSPARDKLGEGCLAAKPQAAPRFHLDDRQRKALAVFLEFAGPSLTRETPAEASQRQVKDLNCQACHRRDGHNSTWNQILEDEALQPEFLPSLSWVGEKLKPEWTKKLLAGEHDHRARPWLKARMPSFPARAEFIAVGLSHEHGFRAGEDDAPVPDAKLAAVGEKLIEQQGGFNCVMCHDVGKRKAVAPFEAPGINLLDAARRLRHHYYPRWMIDPPHVDITTRMPKFSQDGKTTPIREVFDGDAFRQYDAVWHYIQTLK